MKTKHAILPLLGLLLMAPLSSGAADYSDFDGQQKKLMMSYETTLKTVGSPTIIQQQLKNKNAKRVQSSIHSIGVFFKEYDQFNLNKIDFFMKNALFDLKLKYNQAKPYLNSYTLVKLDQLLAKIETNYQNYSLRKVNIGKEKDFERVIAGRDFFNGIGDFSNLLKKELGGKENRIWGVKLLPFIDNTKEFLPVAGDFLHLLYSSYFQTRKNKPNQAPIIDGLRKISQDIAKNRKTKTQWFGLENLSPMPLDGETLNLFVFMHANSYYDTSVQGTLKLEGLSSIGNVDVIFPKFLVKRMIKSDHIITVGHGDNFTKTENLIHTRQLNKFFIAPEGLTPVGFYETRPLVDTFTESVYTLIEQGLKINIYPVSFPENFRFLNDFRRPIEGDKLAYGMIHPLLKSEDLVELLKMTKDKQAAAQLIRWIWFNDLKSNEALDMGMPKPTQMKKWFDGMVWGNI